VPAEPIRRSGDPDRHSPWAAGLPHLLVVRPVASVHPDPGMGGSARRGVESRIRLAVGTSRPSTKIGCLHHDHSDVGGVSRASGLAWYRSGRWVAQYFGSIDIGEY